MRVEEAVSSPSTATAAVVEEPDIFDEDWDPHGDSSVPVNDDDDDDPPSTVRGVAERRAGGSCLQALSPPSISTTISSASSLPNTNMQEWGGGMIPSSFEAASLVKMPPISSSLSIGNAATNAASSNAALVSKTPTQFPAASLSDAMLNASSFTNRKPGCRFSISAFSVVFFVVLSVLSVLLWRN